MHPADGKRTNSEAALRLHLNEHPGVAYRQRTFDPRAIQLSDFMKRRELHATALYREYYRPLNVEYQISVALAMGSSDWVVLALGRGREDFSARDRCCLNVLLPHLVEGYRSAIALSTHSGPPLLSGLDTTDSNLVILDNTMKVLFNPPRARALFTEYLDNSVRLGHLPDSLERWCRHHTVAGTRNRDLLPVREPFVVEQPGKRLVVRLYSAEHRHFLLPQEEILNRVLSLRALGLTKREAQILNWAAVGQTNTAIGATLGIRPRTVSKHLERIFLKLRVKSRTSAALKAFGLI